MRFYICLYVFILTNTLYAKNITVIGIGKVGLSLALSLEKVGFNVLGVDINSRYIEALNKKDFFTKEPYLNDYLLTSKNFKATTSLEEGLNFSDTIFVFVSTTYGTPSYNYTALIKLMNQLADTEIENKHIIINSTVMPGFIEKNIRPLFCKKNNITLSYNPPFIAQGDIVRGLRNPDMVLIGVGSETNGKELKEIYSSVCLNNPFFAVVSVESAEIIKMGLNCFVTTKIAFANLIGDIADKTPGANKYEILEAIGKDKRIGGKYFKPGYGFGGPCFTRDNKAFVEYVSSIGLNPLFFVTTDLVNQEHSKFMAEQFIENHLETYVFEDLSYKENSPVKIIESSQKLNVARMIAESGKTVILKDEESILKEIESIYGQLFKYQPFVNKEN
jgi:UDPglucose 6-dehydrogenase